MKIALLPLIAHTLVHGYNIPAQKNYQTHDYYVVQSHLDSSEMSSALEAFGEEYGMKFVENVGELDNHHLFKVDKGRSLDDLHSSLSKRDHYPFRSLTYQQPRQKLHKRAPLHPDTDSARVAQSLGINDPIFADQWHLVNDKKPEHSINVAPVWQQGIKGQGVRVAVVDDGLDIHSEDLSPSFFPEGSWDFNDHTALPIPRLREDSHGTRCAGEIAAASNDVCGVGVAYESKVAGIRILSTPISDADEATALNYAYQLNDIYSCSWGPPDDGRSVEAPSDLIAKAFVNGVQRGRSGKGSLFVFASGNGAASDDQCNFDGYTNSIYSITVAAISRDGTHPYYSEACTANLVVTYSSGSYDSIHTTDVGANACTSRHGGTSAAAPIAAGIYALVLQVRPDLGWRDLQHLSVNTAEPINLEEDGWAPTAAGRMYNNRYGYGKLNTEKIVDAAHNHKLVKPQAWYEAPIVKIPNGVNIVGQPLNGQWYESNFHLSANRMRHHNIERLEHITATVWIDHDRRGDIEVELISPNNVKSVLAKPRRYDGSTEGLNGWKFMSTKHWDENPVGDWKIRVKDGFHPKKRGNFKAWSIGFWGEAADATKAVDYVLPFERPEGDSDNGDDDDDDDDDNSSSDMPEYLGPSTTYQRPKPTDHLPEDHHEAGDEIPESSYTPTPDEGYLDNSTFLLNHQSWLIGAALAGLSLVAAVGTVWVIRRKKAQELARADEDSRGVYASLNQGGGDSHRMTEFSSNNGGRTRELYDAFKLADSDSEESDEDNGKNEEYKDEDETERGDESQVLYDKDDGTGNVHNEAQTSSKPWNEEERNLIPQSVASTLPAGYSLRPLSSADYDKGHINLLSVLSKATDPGRQAYVQRFNFLKSIPDTYYTIIITDNADKVVGCGTVLLERKFLRGLGVVGHIEDIAVDKNQQGKSLGKKIILSLTEIAQSRGAYKVILDCSKENIPFYEKCGYQHKEYEMNPDDIGKLLQQMKHVLNGDGDSHPQPEAIAQLAQEVYALDLLQLLIKKIGKLEFEARKEVTTVFNCLLRRQIGLRYPTVEYILTKPQVLFLTLDGYNDEDVSLNTGMILREMLRHEALVKLLLYDEQHFYTFPKYIETTTFGVSCDAFSNFKECLTRHKALVAEYLELNYDRVFVANPKKAPTIAAILRRNREKLIVFLKEFHNDKDDEVFTVSLSLDTNTTLTQAQDEKMFLIHNINELNLSNAASILFWTLKEINQVNWAGFYIHNKSTNILELGPFHGLPACQTIKAEVNKGICADTFCNANPILVPNVDEYPVVPLFASSGTCVGVMDFDSLTLNGFEEVDKVNMVKIASLLANHCDFTSLL
ncbi:hypothetical protein E3P77_00013 [Wallemia ichthyophaga]|nr:hypothetical protein E3P77_00013 [Wallemia ichthyophaga]